MWPRVNVATVFRHSTKVESRAGHVSGGLYPVTIWEQFGFRENPYTTSPITANEEGVRLLVGRDKELKRLWAYLSSTSTHPTIEGANGVGKTSLVAVAGFQAVQAHREGRSSQLFIPMP